MALADHYKEADVLDTLSWVSLDIPKRIARLANLYIAREGTMRTAHRNYEGPTKGTVRVFIKSVYVPPMGQNALTINGVLAEIPRQKKTQEEREKRRPWKFRRLSVTERRNAVAKSLYTIWIKPRWVTRDKKKEQGSINCIGITKIAGVTLLVDTGGYQMQPRIYMRQHATSKVKVVVLKGERIDSIVAALTRLAPKTTLMGMFDGKPLTFDFENEGFLMEGRLHPWRNVQRIYIGAEQAHKAWGNPKSGTD